MISSQCSTLLFYFLAILFIKAILITIFILYGNLGLGPDEAQYWTWSRALDWGYYSKPPGIAWQIWLGTHVVGHTELGVRLISIFISIAQSLAVYFLALRCGLKPLAAFWSGMIMAFSPIGILGSVLATTDGGFLLFWTLACGIMVTALRDQREANPFAIGLSILAGALFKWPIYLFWIFFFLFRRWYFPQQSFLKSLEGVGLSLLGLLPSLWWNSTHDWVTFRHVWATMQGGSQATTTHGNFFEFIGSQIFLLSPIWFILLGMALCLRRHMLTPPLVFCRFVSLSSLAVLAIASFFQKIQGNWGVFAYPTGIVLIAWYACEWIPRKVAWLKWGLGLSVGLMALVSLLTLGQNSLLPYRMNPFKHNLGWNNLKEALRNQGYVPAKNFLVSDKYQATSLLSFYNEEQERAYFLNLQGMRKNQFSYWPSLQEEQKGKRGYFIWIENAPYLQLEWKTKLDFYQKELEQYFEQVEFVELSPLVYQGTEIVKAAFIFRCHHCYDQQPIEPNLY